MGDNGELEHVMAVVHASPGLWLSVDWRTIAVKTGDGIHNIGTRVYLDPREPSEVSSFEKVAETQNYILIQQVWSIEELPGRLSEFTSGSVALKGRDVFYVEVQNGKPERNRTYHGYYHFGDVSDPVPKSYTAWSAHSFTAYGSTVHDVLRMTGIRQEILDHQLRAAEAPIDGLADAETFFLERSRPSGPSTAAGMELFAPYHIRFDRRSAETNADGIEVCAVADAAAHVESARIGIFVIGDRRLPDYKLMPRGVFRGGTGQTGHRVTIPLTDFHSLKLFLIVDDWTVDRLLIPASNDAPVNRRASAYLSVDPDLEIFDDWLLGGNPSKAKEFEAAVGRLLVLLGFQCDQLSSQRRLDAALDHLAHDPDSDVTLAIECTTGSLDSGGKLGKLAARATRLSGVAEIGEVVPVMVTALPRQELSERDLDAAAADAVAVVSADELQTMRAQALGDPRTSDVVSFVRSLRPVLRDSTRQPLL